MHSIALSFVVLAGAADDADKLDAGAELGALLSKLVNVRSYHGEYVSQKLTAELGTAEEELVPDRRDDPTPWEIEFERDVATRFVRGHADVYRNETMFVYLDQRGRWIGLERAKASDPSGVIRHDGREARGMSRVLVEIEQLPMPHLFLVGFESEVRDVTRTESDGKVVYSAIFAEAAARRLVGNPVRRGDDDGGGETKKPADRKPADRKPAGEKEDELALLPLQEAGAPSVGERSTCTATLALTAVGGVVESIEIAVIAKAERLRHVKKSFTFAKVDELKLGLLPEVQEKLSPKKE